MNIHEQPKFITLPDWLHKLQLIQQPDNPEEILITY